MKATETTILTALVNMKCVGYPGKCITHFPLKERKRILDELLRRGWIDEHAQPTDAAQPIITANLHLCQY